MRRLRKLGLDFVLFSSVLFTFPVLWLARPFTRRRVRTP
jgi:hypothetical protein